jgi:hypothetical protein
MSARRRLGTLGVAAGGLLIGHWLVYAIVSPATPARTALLRHTGHAYLGAASQLALVLALMAFAAMVMGELNGAGGPTVAGLIRRMVTFQVSAFVLMEATERIVGGVPLAGLLRSGILPLGVAAQVAVGLVAAATIRWLLRVADLVADVLARATTSPSRASGALRPRVAAFVVPDRHLSATGVRGPPSSV